MKTIYAQSESLNAADRATCTAAAIQHLQDLLALEKWESEQARPALVRAGSALGVIPDNARLQQAPAGATGQAGDKPGLAGKGGVTA